MADKIIIVGTRRGNEKVSIADLAQMAGRCGRKPGDIGNVFILANSEDVEYVSKNIVGGSSMDVQSVMADAETTAFHLVSEIANGAVKTKIDASEWWKKTFAGFNGKKDQTSNALDVLIESRTISPKEPFSVTDDGHTAHALYFHPLDVAGWRDNFAEIFDREIETTDAAVAWAASHVREGRSRYHPDFREGSSDFLDQVSSLGLPTDGTLGWGIIWNAALGGQRLAGCGSVVSSLRCDLDRHIEAFLRLNDAHGWDKRDFLDALRVRAKRGMSADMTDLCFIQGMSRSVAQELLEMGITNKDELMEKMDTISTMGSETLITFLQRHNFGT